MFRSMKKLSIIYDNAYYKSTVDYFPTKIYKANSNSYNNLGTINNNYSFLGVIKRVPHYINENDEIFIKDENKYDYYIYVSNWCKLYKMPYTMINPQKFCPLKLRNKRYFYDYREFDTYYYDETIKQVYYKGKYDSKNQIIKMC